MINANNIYIYSYIQNVYYVYLHAYYGKSSKILVNRKCYRTFLENVQILAFADWNFCKTYKQAICTKRVIVRGGQCAVSIDIEILCIMYYIQTLL